MNVNNLPVAYYKASTQSDYYVYDGFGANKPNEIQGRLLLIGLYDMSKECQWAGVRLASTSPYTLVFSDAQNCSSEANEAFMADGQAPEINDRVLLKDQEKPEENGIYIVTKIGSDNEKFELKRASDASAINAMVGGKFVIASEGATLAGNVFQLMPYNTKLEMGVAPFHFINLTEEGFYANTTNGFRLLGSIACNQIENANNYFNFACPGFLNIDCPRMLKILVGYNVKVSTIMENLLTKSFDLGSLPNPNVMTSESCYCNNTLGNCSNPFGTL